MTTRLAATLLTAVVAVLLVSSPAGAWSTSDGAVSIHATSSYSGSVPAVQVDSAGNIYACGHFRSKNGSWDVDPNPAVTNNLNVSGLHSSVISKYNPSGNLLWYLVVEADNDDRVLDCALNAAGTHLAVSGTFEGNMNFPDGAAAIASAGDTDAYVALIATDTSTGTTAPSGVLWGKTLGGVGLDAATGVGFGSSNEVYVGGHFKDNTGGTVDINWGVGSADNRTSAGHEDSFLTKFAVDGSLEWSKTWGGTSNDFLHDLAIDGNDIYVGGYLANQASDYDPGSGEELIGGTSGGQGGQDSWISKFNPSGDLQWVKSFGSSSNDMIKGIAATGGNVYATGWQLGAGGDWDTGSGTIVIGSSHYEPFTIKLNSSGVTQWVFAVDTEEGAGPPTGESLAVDGSGNVYTAGTYRATADLGSGSGVADFTANRGTVKDEVFLLKHNSSGVHQWAKVFPSYGNAYPHGLTTLGSDVYMSGYFSDWMDFDPSAGDATIRSAGSSDGYVAKYTSAGVLAAGNAPLVANPPSGFQVVHGPVDGAELQGYEAEVVLATPLCTGGQWVFNRPSNGTSVRQYIVQDSALSSSGLGIGAYIKANFTDGGSTVPHHNLLWVGGQIDHDGNTSARAGVFKTLGWSGGFNNDHGGDITFKLEADGSLKYTKSGQSVWKTSTVDYDGSGSAGTGVVPSGWSVYLAFPAKSYTTTRTLTSDQLNASHSSCGTPGFTVSETSRTVSESGSTQTFTVVLTGDPSSDVVIDVASNDTGEATVSASSLTFTSSNWDTAQTITVTGIPDYSDDGNQTSTATLSVNDGSSDDDFDSVDNQTVSVTTTDIDAAPGLTVTQTGGSTSVNEASSGNTDTFTVVLDMQPAPGDNVVVTVTSSDTTEAQVNGTSARTLTFTSSNWDTPQTVTVTGIDDDIDDGNQTPTLTLAVADASSYDPYDSVSDESVSVTVVDDDTAGFTLSGTTAAVSENETTATFTVVLDSEPTGNVVFSLSSADTGETTVSPAALTFTSSNWDTPQTVTVTGVDDSASDGNQTTNVTVAVNDSSTADNTYDALGDQAVAVTTADNDSAGVTISASGGATTVSEAGSTDTFTVVLNTQPSSDVVINVSSGDTGEATVSPTALTFTSSNWDTPQTVTVTGVDDDTNDGDQTTTITVFVVDGSSDDAYDSVANLTLGATTTDDDSPGLTLSTTSVTVTEAGSASTFTVRLNTKPSSNVVVNVSTSDSGEATASTTALTFTPSNWDTAQTVTVTGADDVEDDGNQTSTVTLSVNDASSDDDYDSVTDSTVAVTTVDDDDPVVTTTTAPPPTTTAPALGTISLSAIPGCSSVTIHWAPGTTAGLQSFSLASRAPGDPRGWITHSTHLSTTRSFAIGNLANGLHSFEIRALYDNGTSADSNEGNVTIADCSVIVLPPPTPVTTTTTTPPTTTTTTAPTTTTTALPTATATPPTTTTTALPTATATPPTTTTTALPTTTTANTTPPTTTTTATTTTAAPATTVPTTTAAGGGTGATSTTTTTAPPPPTTATAGTGGSGGPGSGGTGTTTTQPPSPTASSVGGQDGGGTGSVSAALTSAPNDGSNLVNPTSVVIAAAALCALAAGLGWWSALGRLLAGTTLGAFLLAFWRRRKVPGPPREVLVISDGTVDRFTWVKPTRGKDPDRYSIEGLVDDSWLVVHEHTTTVTHAEHPVSTFPVATTWRIRASNDHGTGQPSDEVDPVVVTESTSFEEGPMSGREDRGSDGD